MYGMPLAQALLFVAMAAVLVAAVQWRVHAFVAIVVLASVFGAAAGFSTGLVGKSFGNGFSQAAYSPGLVIIAAALVSGLAEHTGASLQLGAAVGRHRWLQPNTITAAMGAIAGVGATASTAFALVTPLLPALGGGTKPRSAPVTLALAISASHGLVLFSPPPILAASIIGASWDRVALFGLPLAILLVVVCAAWARLATPAGVDETPESPDIARDRSRWPTTALLLATAVPVLMLMIQSIGSIPSEPLGGGPTREMILGLGRPLILLLVSVGIMLIGTLWLGFKLLTDNEWTGRILASAATTVLVIAAAGGLQGLCQETGMAESLGERMLGLHGGVLVPFLVAATIKTLQGSSLVAAIAAAGMIQPMLASLGLAGESGKALATLAIGAGSMTMSHVNDEFFWLVASSARLSPLRSLTAVTAGTLLQGIVAVVALLALSMFVPGL